MAIVMDKFHAEDSTTNTVVTIAEFIKKSSGTPASGIGAAIALGAEDSAGNAEQAVQIHGYLTTVTSTSEQGAFLLRVKNAGSFMDALAITVASNTVTVGSNQTTVNLWNSTATTVNAFGASTATAIGATSDGAYVNMCALRLTALNPSTNGLVGFRANMRVSNQYSNASDNVTLRLDCDGASAATKAIQFYRISAAATGATTVTVFVPNTSTVAFEVDAKTGNTTWADAANHVFGTSTGTKHGTGTTQKQSFWNATPIAQPSSTGETTGFTAGGGTNVTDASTFTGNVGSTAYRISDIVKHLKNIGLIAA